MYFYVDHDSPHKMMMMDHINHNSSGIFWQQTLIVRLDFSGMCVAGHNALMSEQTEVSKFLVLLISTEHNAHNILTWTHFCVQNTEILILFLCCRKHCFDEKTNTTVHKQANFQCHWFHRTKEQHTCFDATIIGIHQTRELHVFLFAHILGLEIQTLCSQMLLILLSPDTTL